jgi:hypothetical protein
MRIYAACIGIAELRDGRRIRLVIQAPDNAIRPKARRAAEAEIEKLNALLDRMRGA